MNDVFLKNKLTKTLNAPIAATICPTERCNLICRHCFGAYGIKSKRDKLDFKAWTKIIDCLKEYVLKIEVTGGEPLLSSTTLPLLRYIKKNKFCVISVNTNGTLITKRVAYTLSKLRPELQFVKVSLDGATPEVHEYIRGKGTYKLVIRGIKNLRDNNIPVIVASMVHKMTSFEDIEEMYKLSEELNFYVQYGTIFPVGEALRNWKSIFLSPDAFNEISEFILKKERESRVDDQIIGMRTEIEQEEYSVKRTLGRCSAGYKGLTVMSDGMLAACQLLLLNQFSGDILNVWKNDIFLKKIRDYKREDDVEICKKCKERSSCFKTCIGASYNVFGDFRAPSPYCILYHEYLDLREDLVNPHLKMLKELGIEVD